MPHDQKTKNMKQKQYCNKFNKDFKNGPHQKKKILKKKVLRHMELGTTHLNYLYTIYVASKFPIFN